MSLIFDHPETFNVVVTCLSVLAFKQFLGSSVWIAGVRLEGHFIAWKRARIPNPSHCCLSTFYATWMFKSILAVEWVQQNVRTSGLKTKYLRIYVHIIESFEKFSQKNSQPAAELFLDSWLLGIFGIRWQEQKSRWTKTLASLQRSPPLPSADPSNSLSVAPASALQCTLLYKEHFNEACGNQQLHLSKK